MSKQAIRRFSLSAKLGGVLLLMGCGQLVAAEFIPMGFLPGGAQSAGFDVSDDGTVVAGEAHLGIGPNGVGLSEVFRWTDSSGMVGLGALPGHNASVADWREPMSADGSVIVGTSRDTTLPAGDPSNDGGKEIFIYTEGQGMVPLGETGSEPLVSADGQTILTSIDIRGQDGFSIDDQVLLWDNQGVGWTLADEVPGFPTGDGITVSGISPDASIVVGDGNQLSPLRRDNFVWTAASGTSELDIPGFEFNGFTVKDEFEIRRVTNDGSVMVGTGKFLGEEEEQAFRWTDETGAVGLGWLPNPGDPAQQAESSARDMTDDGSVIVGISRGTEPGRSFIWSEQFGMEDLQDVLVDRFGLGAELDGWSLALPNAISPNGQFIVGSGLNPDGGREGWLVRLDRPFLAVPEPSGVALLICGCIAVPLAHRRRNMRVDSRF